METHIAFQDLIETSSQELSPYDVSYPVVLLSDGIKRELTRAQIVAQNIYGAVVKQMPMLTEVQQAMHKGCRYVVDASESTLKAIESGALRLTQENGRTFAQLKVNGKYGSKLPIKKRFSAEALILPKWQTPFKCKPFRIKFRL